MDSLYLAKRAVFLRAALAIWCMTAIALPALAATRSVLLAWDPPDDPTVTGYFIHYGSQSGVYSTTMDVSTQTNALVTNLTVGATYFFVVTAYNADGVESDPSNEVSAEIPPTNSPPVAGTDAMERCGTNLSRISIATLLANDSDADGDVISFVSCDTTSANGGSLIASNGWIFSEAAPGNGSNDRFTYTISDDHGGVSTGTVEIVVTDPTSTAEVQWLDFGGGLIWITGSGIPGREYEVRFTESMTVPVWQPLGAVAADESGVIEYLDTQPEGTPERFYALISQ